MNQEKEIDKQSTRRTNWHRLFETVNQKALTPVGLNVHPEHRVMSDPPVVDILLLRNEDEWTEVQKARLPDGVRHSKARHILLDLKKSESLNQKMLFKTLAYDTFYKATQNLKDEKVQSFLLSAKTPQRAFWQEFEYEPTEHAGVYHSHNRAFRYVDILVLNKLGPELHNAFVKCFASREKEARNAFQTYFESDLSQFLPELTWYMLGLRDKILGSEGGVMNQMNFTPEEVLQTGRQLARKIYPLLPTEERVAGLSLQERIAGLKLEEVLSQYKPEEVFSQYKPEERIAGLKPEELFSSCSFEELMAYVQKRQLQKAAERYS